jgi:hypothetical protein
MGNLEVSSITLDASERRHQMEAGQLSKLSSVLNGLEGGASAMRRHVQEAMRAVRSGTYTIDSLQLSRRIISEAMGPA